MEESKFEYGGLEVVFLKHAGFMVKGSKTLYIDPYDLPKDVEMDTADYIFITHDHFDHMDFDAIKKLSGTNTTVVIPQGCSIKGETTCTLGLNEKQDLDDVSVETVPAYNVGKEFHPKAHNYVGYVITMDGVTIYHAGDTDHTSELEGVTSDIALIPVGGKFTMNVEDAKSAIEKINARHVIPMHYDTFPDIETDVSKLKSEKVTVLKPMFS